MQLNKLKPFAFSILIHVGIIALIIGVALPHQKQIDEPTNIQSYLYIKPPQPKPRAAQPILVKPEPTDTLAPVEGKQEEGQSIKAPFPTKAIEKQNIPLPQISQIETVDEQAPQSEQKPQQTQLKNTNTNTDIAPSVLTNSAKFITELNSQQLNALSQQSANDYRQPQPLIDKSKTQSRNKQLKTQSDDFAPPGSDIVVLSEFGLNETTIMVDDSCMTITETDLHDPITRGASIWRFGGAGCQKYDKFNGQLQKSLDKYLKK